MVSMEAMCKLYGGIGQIRMVNLRCETPVQKECLTMSIDVGLSGSVI